MAAKSPIMSTATATGATSKLEARCWSLRRVPSAVADKATVATVKEPEPGQEPRFFLSLYRLNRLTGCDCNLTVNCVWQMLCGSLNSFSRSYPPARCTLASPALISLMCAWRAPQGPLELQGPNVRCATCACVCVCVAMFAFDATSSMRCQTDTTLAS